MKNGVPPVNAIVRSDNKTFRWDLAVIAGALLLLTATFTAPLEVLLGRWLRFDEAYSHGLFVFVASLFLVGRVLWRNHFPPAPSVIGIVLAGLTAVAIALADVVNIQILQQMGAVFLWWAIVVALLGWRAGLRLAIPIGFLYYAVPVWDYLTTPLVQAAVMANDFLLGLRGIHFQVDGVFIHLLDVGTFEIAGGCSGLRYLVIALTLATLFSTLNLSRIRDWIILHSAAIAMALLVNWVRIFVIILMGYETRMETGLIDDHEFFGWILFAIALIPFFYLANRLMTRSPSPTLPTGNMWPGGTKPFRLVLGTLALVVLVTIPPLYLSGSGVAVNKVTLEPPDRIGDWQHRPEAAFGTWQPQMRNTDTELRATYTLTDKGTARSLHLGVWYYAHQDQGRELVQWGNHLYDRHEWSMREHRRIPVNGGDWGVMILDHRHYGGTYVVAYGYYVANRWVSRELMVKANMLRAALTRQNDGALLTTSMRCRSESCTEEMATITRDLGVAVVPETEALLAKSGLGP